MPVSAEGGHGCAKGIVTGRSFGEARPIEKVNASAQRVKNSKEFAKFVKELDQLKARKARKKVPLNEKEMKDQFTDEDAKKTDNLNIDGDPAGRAACPFLLAPPRGRR